MLSENFSEKYGPWALVTGAAEGLGEAFAELIAAQRIDLVLADVQGEKLARTSENLRHQHGVSVREVVVDLKMPDFISAIEEKTRDIHVGLLVANAAIGQVGKFQELALEDMLDSIDVNVKAPLILAHHYSSGMIREGKGGIVFLSSSSAYQGTPFVANYAGTKSYNLLLGEALWYELGAYGVDVLAYSAGATNTPSLRSSQRGLKEGVHGNGVLLPSQAAIFALSELGKCPSTQPGAVEPYQKEFSSRDLNRKKAIMMAGNVMAENFS